MFSPVSENPTQMSPSGPQTEKAARPQPAAATNTASARVDSRRMNSA